ncbi:MAG TPA: alkaline phosphatase family protein [Polyangia bacterium]|nr:alkaline phosphatase family protein [Polyangia bacterium]
MRPLPTLGACLLAGLSIGASACHARPAVESAASRPKPPRLLLAIVVDQLSAWEAADRLPMLPPEGGFARLRREGLWVKELRYEHAVTDTAPGHAALFTGAPPRASGIFANETLGPDGKSRSILLDETTRLVDARGQELDRPGSSLARLRVETLADVLVAAAPGALVYAFSLKDRGALFGAGRRPQAALWLDVAGETFVSSTAFPAPPFLVSSLSDNDAVEGAYRSNEWSLRNEERSFVSTHAETPDDQPGEGDYLGLGRTFPHVATSAKAMRATPAGDALVLGLARGALEYVGGRARGDQAAPPALLVLSLSSHDYIEHVFGPHSWEAWAELWELDRGLGALFTEADRAVGPAGWAALLTGDHGGGALPEVPAEVARTTCGEADGLVRPSHGCGKRARIMPRDVVAALEAAAQATLGPGPWIAGFAEPLVYLTPRGKSLDAGARETLRRAAERAARAYGVEHAFDTRSFTGSCPSGDGLEALVCASVVPDGPGDFYLVAARGSFFDPDLAPGAGQSHGTFDEMDRTVPLLVRAPGRAPPGVVRDAPLAFTAFARTAASLLGVRPPAAAGPGEDLTEGRALP